MVKRNKLLFNAVQKNEKKKHFSRSASSMMVREKTNTRKATENDYSKQH